MAHDAMIYPTLRIVFLYLLLSSLWILLSDQFLQHYITDPVFTEHLELLREWSLVLASTLVLFFLLRRENAVARRANEILSERERNFRILTETIATAIFLHRGGRLCFVNPKAIDYSGYTREELLTMDLWQLVAPEYREMVKERSLARLSNSGGPALYELKIITKQGSERWLEVTADNIEFEGHPVALATAYDITERMQAEHLQRKSEEAFRILFEVSRDAIMTISIEYGFLSGNTATVSMFGCKDEREFITLSPASLSPEFQPDGRRSDEKVLEMMLVALNTGSHFFEWTHKRMDGSEFFADVLFTCITIEDTLLLQATVRDITGRKQAEMLIRTLNTDLEHRVAVRTAELETANISLISSQASIRKLNIDLQQRAEELQASVQEMQAFSYSVSHDLRAPLRAIQGFTQALQEDYASQLDPAGQDFAQRIVTAANRMDILIQDLLAYSQLSRSELNPKPVSLAKIVAEAIAQLQSQIAERQARISIIGSLPEALGHYQTLVQVIANLLSNAIKFVTPDTSPLIQISAEMLENRVRLCVDDNGIGIPAEHAERIFKVFERLHGIETYPGTGIGLAIVRKGMERMGGRAGFLTKENNGSRFWIELPLTREV